VIRDAPNYEIITNQNYAAAFQYIPIERCKNEEDLQVADLITKVLYMGYTRDKQNSTLGGP
jgi:hypothetical protein